jgi:putative transposase
MGANLPTRKKNRLPLEVYKGQQAYSLTLTTHSRRPWFRGGVLAQYCLKCLASSADGCGFSVYAYCFMPDHVHLLVGGQTDESDLVDFVKRFKQLTGWWFLNRYRAGSLKASPTPLWQRSYHDRVLRAEQDVRVIAEYIIANPVRAGLSDEPGHYANAGSLVWSDLGPAHDRRTSMEVGDLER